MKPSTQGRTITVLRTAVGSPASVGLIQALKRRNIRVIGTDCNPLSAGFRFCDKSYVTPWGDDPKFLRRLLDICDIERPHAIISGPEEEVLTLSKNKRHFTKRGVVVLTPDHEAVAICADKLKTDAFFRRQNVPPPDVFHDEASVTFPAIIKPRFGRGGTDVFMLKDRRALQFFSRRVDKPILQQFIAGTEYTVDILSDLRAEPLSVVPRTRIHVESGISMKGRTVNDEEIIAWSRTIAKALKLTGPSCIQCIRDKAGIKFIEVNPRFGGGSMLSVKADPSIMRNLTKLITGEQPTKSNGFKPGLTMLRYYSEVYF